MKSLPIIFLFSFFIIIANAQLSGTAFLQGQSNHAGIQIKFTAQQGGTGVTDSSYTDAVGNYSINIAPGVYTVKFSKAGYIDAFYNNNATVVLTNTTVLPGITLVTGNAVYVAGTLTNTTWTSANTYVVTGDITIPTGNTLTILAGTKVQFNGYYEISGGGAVQASGSTNNPVIFTSGKQNKARNDWKNIGLTSTTSFFDNCIIEYASFALNFQGGGARLTNSIIRHGETTGMYVAAGTPLIENNEIYDLIAPQAAVGIWAEGSSSGTITCNYVHDIAAPSWNSYGVIHNSSLVSDNHIENITGQSPKGIQSRYANARNINNFIANSGTAIELDGSWTTSNPVIINNTLNGNQAGVVISCASYPLNATIANNLITNNSYGVIQNGTTSGTISINHNLLWNQSTADYNNVQLAGIGQTVTTNSSGYPIDSYYNMAQDPLFSGNPPYLQATSPCYGTGNPVYSTKVGFTNPQACAASVLSISEKKNNNSAIRLYPNPSTGFVTIAANKGKDVTFNLYDLQGRTLLSANAKPGEWIDLSSLANGVYLACIQSGDSTTTSLLTLTK